MIVSDTLLALSRSKATQNAILNFNLSPLTISPSIPTNSSISHAQLTYLPPNLSLLSPANHTIVSPAIDGSSLNPSLATSPIPLESSVLTAPGLTQNANNPSPPYSNCSDSVHRNIASFELR